MRNSAIEARPIARGHKRAYNGSNSTTARENAMPVRTGTAQGRELNRGTVCGAFFRSPYFDIRSSVKLLMHHTKDSLQTDWNASQREIRASSAAWHRVQGETSARGIRTTDITVTPVCRLYFV